jgi:ribulose bisphosphate carboxylase small subunit
MTARPGRLLWRRLLMAALAAVAIFIYWTQVAERGERDLVRSSAASDTSSQTETRGFGPGVGFADQRRLDEHYQKHGTEFGRITKQDYLRQAQLLRDAKVGGPVLEVVRRDGVVTRYDQQTGAFIAFNPNGVIRTFFKPNDGERYWRRQAERGE